MCGLVGVINLSGTYKVDYDNYFKQALICDSVRGKHSTGIFMKTDKTSLLVKRAVNAIEFLKEANVDKAINGLNRLMMGHNRFATKGGISNETAHPFKHGEVTLCHNGTLHYHQGLLKNKSESFDVDSEAICYLLSETDDPSEVLEQLDGAFALTWYDNRNKTFNIARNSERKLYIAKVLDTKGEQNGAYLYASECGMLEWLAKRNDLRIETPLLVPVGEILSWDLFGESKDYTITKFIPKPVTNYSSYGNYYVAGDNNSNNNYQTKNIYYGPLSPLVNKTVDVVFYAFQEYNNSLYGEVHGYFDDDYKTIAISGKTGVEADDLISRKSVSVKITGYNENSKKYYGMLMYPISNSKSTNVIALKKDDKGIYINPILDDEDETLSNNQKKRENVRCCRNCDELLHLSNTFKAFNGELYCNDCHDMYPEVIY